MVQNHCCRPLARGSAVGFDRASGSMARMGHCRRRRPERSQRKTSTQAGQEGQRFIGIKARRKSRLFYRFREGPDHVYNGGTIKS